LCAYSLFDSSVAYVFGGSEIRAHLFARGLSRLPGYQVSFIVLDHGQPKTQRFGQITVFRHSFYRGYPTAAGLPGLWERGMRVLRGHLGKRLYIGEYAIDSDKTRIYREVNADAFCVFGVADFTAEVAAYCRHAGKPLALFSAHDHDFSESYYEGSRQINPWGSMGTLCDYAVRQADLIITQTHDQAAMALRRFGKASTTIYNPIDLADRVPPAPGERVALWIGKANDVKQPHLLLRLAAQFPAIPFIMIMNRSHPVLFEKILCQRMPNVSIIERVPFPEVEALFARAFVLVNTSVSEGFPNTFLQAGKYGVPVLSLNVDPDHFIQRHDCGIVAKGDVQRLADGLSLIASDPQKARYFSQNIRRYVAAYHRLEDKVRELDATLQRFLDARV